jgi:uncharacterized protein VirK/YbjX
MGYVAYFRTAYYLHPDGGLRGIKNRLKLIALVVQNKRLLDQFVVRVSAVLKERMSAFDVDYVGTVQWPYISSGWNPRQSLECIASHYEYLAQRCPKLLLVDRQERIQLARISRESTEYQIVIDRPSWFKREGELVLNLFQDDLRIVSLAFSIYKAKDEAALFIGAIQGLHSGIDSETSLQLFRDVTKKLHGLRPRSLMVEGICILARAIGVTEIYAIKDKCRHHRHPYFGVQKAKDLGTGYDEIWAEQGATDSEFPDFFRLPSYVSRKPENDIPSKKRAMYRRRYELLDEMNASIEQVLKSDELFESLDSINR